MLSKTEAVTKDDSSNFDFQERNDFMRFYLERWLKSIKSESHGLEFDTFEMHKFSVVYCLISLNHQRFGGINSGKHD